MLILSPAQTQELRATLPSDQLATLAALHVFNTGNGVCFVDCWPEPAAAFITTADNGSLVGQPDAQFLAQLRPHLSHFIDTDTTAASALQAAFPELRVWERVVYKLESFINNPPRSEAEIRRLGPADAYVLWGLTPTSSWISRTWGGPPGLAASGMAWGAFLSGRLVALACSFFVGDQYEDIGVVTEPGFRGRGLSLACTAALCADISARKRTPSWSTSPDNLASIRVAEKAGFRYQRADQLYAVGIAIPQPAKRDAGEG